MLHGTSSASPSRAAWRGAEVLAGLLDPSGVDREFSDREVFRREVAGWRIAVDRAVRRASWTLDFILLIYLAMRVVRDADRAPLTRRRFVTVALAGAAVVGATLFAAPLADAVTDEPPQQYPFGLAFLHRVFGDGPFGPLFIRRLLAKLSVALVGYVGSRIVASRRPTRARIRYARSCCP
jgi:hypothetical protein